MVGLLFSQPRGTSGLVSTVTMPYMKPITFLLIPALIFTAIDGLSQSSKERSAEPTVFFYGPSGSNLLRACQAEAKTIDGSFCRGYIAGAVDQMVGLSVQTDTVYCIPSNGDSDQLIRVVLKYLKENPATLNYPAGALVAKAIVAAFPCPPSQR
jgi:hypothetical protein